MASETRFNLTFQESRFAPDLFEFGRSGCVYSRQQLIFTERGRATLPLEDLTIRLLEMNTAHVTYNSHLEYDGVVEHARRSSIWSRQEQGWVYALPSGHANEPYRHHGRTYIASFDDDFRRNKEHIEAGTELELLTTPDAILDVIGR